jgi:hypothetical protein
MRNSAAEATLEFPCLETGAAAAAPTPRDDAAPGKMCFIRWPGQGGGRRRPRAVIGLRGAASLKREMVNCGPSRDKKSCRWRAMRGEGLATL